MEEEKLNEQLSRFNKKKNNGQEFTGRDIISHILFKIL